jgi:UDP-glucose 4-epimerase
LITWIVGAGGLLGSAIRRQSEDSFAGSVIPWDAPEAAKTILRTDTQRFFAEANGGAWTIIWAAGAATVSVTAQQAAVELSTFRALCEAVRSEAPQGPGVFFVTSSAGGVYAGSADPPFDVATAPVPVSPYGELKLAQEASAVEILGRTCAVVIGRFSNLYGPGQNLDKLQGLISRLALSAATSKPINIFVSLDTIRDYVFVDDAAAAALALVGAASRNASKEPLLAIIASGEPATIGQLIRTVNQVTKRKVPVALGSHASAAAQVADLRLIPFDGSIAQTPLPAGVRRVYLDILERLQLRPLVN